MRHRRVSLGSAASRRVLVDRVDRTALVRLHFDIVRPGLTRTGPVSRNTVNGRCPS